MSTNPAEAASGGSFDLLRRATAKMLYNRSVVPRPSASPYSLSRVSVVVVHRAINFAHSMVVVPDSKSASLQSVPRWSSIPQVEGCTLPRHGRTPPPGLIPS